MPVRSPSPLPWHRPIGPADPLRVLLVGDGVMFDAAPAIAAALESTGRARVRADAQFGLGLSHTDPWDWRRIWPPLVAEARPDVVVVMVGPSDIGTLVVDGRPLGPGRPGWWAWYEPQAIEAARVLTAGGADLVWIGATWEGGPETDDPVTALNDELREVVAVTGSQFVEAAALLSGSDGHYTDSVPAPDGALIRLFEPDGSDLCPDGAARLGAAVAQAVSARWGVTPAAGWEAGGWRRDARYDRTIPGAGCADR